MKTLSYALFACALGACTINGKPLFGGGSTTPSSVAPASPGSPATADVTNPVVTARAPSTFAWCKDVADDSQWDDVEDIFSGTEPVDRVLPTIATTLCHPDSDAASAQRDRIEAARQAWLAKLGMTEAEWVSDYIAWHQIPFAHRNASHIPWQENQRAWSTLGPIDQFAYVTMDGGLSQTFTLAGLVAKMYVADALALTEAGRLGFIRVCLKEQNPVVWATCQGDIEAFDRQKLAAELRADTSRPGADKMYVRFELAALDDLLGKHAARVKELSAQDPAYAKLFEIGKATFAQWQERPTGLRAELLALVSQLDNARESNSKKAAVTDCEPRAKALFEKAFHRLPTSSFDGAPVEPGHGKTYTDSVVSALFDSTDIYLAANARIACGGTADYLTVPLAQGVISMPGFRGPRTATLSAIRAANLELDARDARLELPYGMLPLAGGFVQRERSGVARSAVSVIASVQPAGDMVKVVFPKTSQMVTLCAKTVETNRINRIREDGTLEYRTECVGTRRARLDTTIPPIEIAKQDAAMIAAGRYVSIVGGFPEAVWAKDTDKRPLAVFGFTLKQ